jgi:murein DD-endopeptidase MepM/ murein hydrolase activator NlpD
MTSGKKWGWMYFGALTAIAICALIAFLGLSKVQVGPSLGIDYNHDVVPVTSLVASPKVPPPADGFDFPVGPPDAKKYYNAQGFQKNNHLGEDWNGVGGGNTDMGDPVYATATGIVTMAEDYGTGWGNIVRMQHNIGSMDQPRLIESLYAHLDTMLVQVGDTLQRGQKLGKIGDAHGAYWAHLHFEMRHQIDMEVGGGYDEDTTGFLIPTQFIKNHRRMND